MTCEAEVTAARNIRDALIVIARYIDEFAAPTSDGTWAAWVAGAPATNQEIQGLANIVSSTQIVQPEDLPDRVEYLKGALSIETDGETRQALEAELRLLSDDGAPGPTPVDDGVAATFTIPGTNPERQLARYRWAIAVGLHEYIGAAWTSDDAATTFAAGGPLWLHGTNRTAVMALPHAERLWLVEEVGKDSVQDAQELSRDILKFDENTSTLEITEQAVQDGAVSNGR